MENWFLRDILILAFLATNQAWVLQTHNDLVKPGSTADVELMCREDTSTEATPEIDTISSVRITKEGLFGSTLTFVQISAGNDKLSAEEDDIKITGDINKEGSSFLKVKWQVASPNTPGTYGCEINGFDTEDNYVSLHAKPILIKEKMLTVDDVNKLILSVTSEYEKRQQALEVEIVKLKTFIRNELNAKEQQIGDVKETLVSKISAIDENIKVNYSKKTEVSFQISELRNFTLYEIMTKREFRPYQYTICDELNSTILYLKNDMFEKMDSVEKDIKFIDDQMDNITSFFTEHVDRIHSKTDFCCSNAFPTKETHPNRPTARRVSMPTPAKIPSTAPTSRYLWPSGRYFIITDSRVDCSVSDYGGVSFYHFTYTFFSTSVFISDKVENHFKVYLSHGSRLTTPRFCYRKRESSYLTRWTKGSYCIMKALSSCPEGFLKGERKHTIKFETSNGEEQWIGTYKEDFCCRSDGPSNVPLTLPTRDPFYMYRYNGKCQEVRGMHKEQVHIFLWKGARVSTYLRVSLHTPDVDNHGNAILCYYFRLT